jgi:hypothetical protein
MPGHVDQTQGLAATRSRRKQSPGAEAIQLFADNFRLNTRVTSDDGTKIIRGKFGHIYEYNDGLLGVLVMPKPPRRRYWGCTRTTLQEAGLVVVQDGDGEGAATFDPSDPNQAKAAIRVAGVKRRRQLSPEQRERRIAFLRPAQARHLSV